MPIILDRQLREQMPHNATELPITYFHDELITLPNRAGPLHWHPDFEIATARCGVLDYQVGQEHIMLRQGDSVFVNGNILHGITQISGDVADPMPNIVFSGTLVAPQTSTIYPKYIQPVAQCDSLPYIVFRRDDMALSEVNGIIEDTYKLLWERPLAYEMAVQRNISLIFEYIARNFDDFPRAETTRIQISNQIRIQKMLSYIYEHYAEPVTLEEIAKAADVSRSEAGRCFNGYMGCSPVDALIQYRLQTAHGMLSEKAGTLQQICYACGFNSVTYFGRQFKKLYGYPPSKVGEMGK